MRFFLYVQGLSGSGHAVRTGEIARALARNHSVWLTDGGLPVPRPPLPASVSLVALPRIRRDGARLVPLDGSRHVDAILDERRRLLLDTIGRVRPDVLLVEHFPISKWELSPEILPMIDAARRVNARVRVVSSLRDISPRHRYETGAQEHRRRTMRTLKKYFDRLLIHTDPRFATPQEHLPWLEELGIPLDYTGFVSETPEVGRSQAGGDRDHEASVVVSMGGAGDMSLASRVLAAWKRLQDSGEEGGRELSIFLPLTTTAATTRLLGRESAGLRVRIEPFAVDFLERLGRADLSLSYAGYNTCMNLLQLRVRALIVALPTMADQLPRARRFEERGLARVLETADLEPEPLAGAILGALAQPRPSHGFDLNGAQCTCRILEGLEPTTVRWECDARFARH